MTMLHVSYQGVELPFGLSFLEYSPHPNLLSFFFSASLRFLIRCLAKTSNNACLRLIFIPAYFSMFTSSMVNLARKREWKLASDILLTESFLSECFLMVFSQVEIPLNDIRDSSLYKETQDGVIITQQRLYCYLKTSFVFIVFSLQQLLIEKNVVQVLSKYLHA